jgi:hypothetical protein
MRPLNRITPTLPAAAFRSFSILKPAETHTRPATCREADCEAYRSGWVTIAPEGERADYVRTLAQVAPGRDHRWSFSEVPAGAGLVEFRFPAGQPCLRYWTHRVSLDRPELYVVRGGDWRRYTPPARRYDRADQWVDDFATGQARLARLING